MSVFHARILYLFSVLKILPRTISPVKWENTRASHPNSHLAIFSFNDPSPYLPTGWIHLANLSAGEGPECHERESCVRMAEGTLAYVGILLRNPAPENIL